eukprot:6464176-Amphidinium_carterae.2
MVSLSAPTHVTVTLRAMVLVESERIHCLGWSPMVCGSQSGWCFNGLDCGCFGLGFRPLHSLSWDWNYVSFMLNSCGREVWHKLS